MKKTSSIFIVLVMIIGIILITPAKAYAETDTLGYGFQSPHGVAADSSGNVYVADTFNDAIERINKDGSIDTFDSGFYMPFGVAVDSSGNVYVADTFNNAVKRLNKNGSTTPLGSGFSHPFGVAVDSSGNVYVADASNNAIKRINTDGSVITLASGFNNPMGVAVDSSKNVYVADTGNNMIKRINTDGSITPLGSGFSMPAGVAVDSSGNIYVTDTYNNAIKRINTDGSITTLGSGFSFPYGVALDNSGNVYVADTDNNAIKKFLSPKVTSVNVPSAKTYKIGDVLDFNVNFDHPVIVNLTGGTPCLSLILGNKSKNAVYKSGSGSSVLTFSYTVQSGDSDTDGITIGGISLNGGSISSSENVYANLALNNVGSTSGVLVNGVIPTFTNTNAVLKVAVNSGNTDISGLLHVNDTAPTHSLTWSIASSPAHGTLTIENISSNSGGSNIAPGGTISYSPSNGYIGTDSFTIQVSDEDGNESSNTVNVTVYGPPYSSTGAADNISTTSASLKAIVNANYDDTTVTFEYGTSDAYGNIIQASPTVRGGSDTTVSAVISGLLPDTIYHYRVIAQNSFGTSYSADQTFTTLALPQIQTTDPASAMVGNAYSYKFTSTGGTGGNTYNVTSGSLPAGLNLSSDGNLRGTPTVPGTYTFEVTVTDSAGEKSSKTFTLSVNQQFTLSYLTDGNGSIQGSANQTVNYLSDGTSVTAVANTGYHFVKWSDGNTNPTRQDINIESSLTVTAEFAINTYAVTFEDYDCTIIETQTVNYGTSANAPQNPVRTGFSFAGWDKDFSNITSGLTVTAKYTRNQYTLSYLTDGNGIIIGDTAQTIDYLADGTSIAAIPNIGYHFVKWSDGNTHMIRQDTGITGNLTVTAEFAINQYSLKYAADGNGSIQGNTNQTVNYLADGTSVTAVPNTGYHFVKWSDGNTNSTRQDIDIASNLTVTTEFAINTYTVTFKDYDGTIISTQTINYGESANAPQNPTKTGYSFSRWDNDFSNITSDLIATAKYTSGNSYTFAANTASQNTDEAAIAEGYFDSRDNTIIVNINGVTFTIPADAVDITGISNTGYVKTTAKKIEGNMLTDSLPDNMQIVENPFEFDIQLFNGQNILIRDIHQFVNNRNVQVRIKLTDDELKKLDTSKLSAYYYDENSKTWVLLGGSYNSSTHEFTFITPHFTKFAIMEKVKTVNKAASSTDTNSTSNTQILAPHKLVQTGSFFNFDMLICIGGILLLTGIILTAKYSIKKSK